MALADTITTEIIPNYTRKLRDDVGMATPLWEILFRSIEEVDGGSQITEQINYQLSPNVGVFGGGVAPLQADFINSATNATFNPTYHWYSVMIPDTLKILARGEGEIINIFNSQFETALMSLAQSLGNEVWGTSATVNGAPTLSGIQAICTNASDPSGGAYGGITRVGASGPFTLPVGNGFWNANVLTCNGGSQTVWKGAINTGTSTTTSFQMYMAAISAGIVGIYRPSCIIGDVTSWNGLHNAILQTVRQAPMQTEGSVGFPEINFAGIPFLQDDYAPSGSVAFLNDMLKLRPWTDGFFAQMEPVRPYNSLTTIYYGLMIMNMVHTRPNTMTYMTGITQ
jgi:hypothetical protein